MKRILLFVSALAGLFFAASCQQEKLDPMGGGSNVVTYTVEVPDALSTKAIGTDVSAVTELIYEVYLVDSDTKEETKLYRNTETISNGIATVELELVNNQDFRVLFWAQVPNNGVYTTDDPAQGLKAVTLNTNLYANAENYAAFANSDFIEYGEPLLGRTITLFRPVAQLNIATTPESLKLGEKPDGTGAQTTITFEKTGVTVVGLSTTYNVATSTAGSDDATFTYEATLPYNPNNQSNGDNLSEKILEVGNKDYAYVSMNYVGFAQPTGDNVKVTYTIKTNEVGTITNTISNVPVKANYRTNIIGNLITSMSDYTVTLENNWTDLPGGNMEVIADGLVKNINGDYEVTNEVGLAYAINNLFVDANGVANEKSFYVKPDIYDMALQAINDITVTSGTLKVYDTDAVVTRSTTAGSVVIKGLKKALINTVEEGATVFFSGITVKDFNGADDAAALVLNNEGKVVLADCQILDENGAPDQYTELVGGNEPIEVEKGEEAAGDLIYTAEQLAAAFADEAVESIVLGADITLENTLVFPEDRTAILDLRGWELTVNEPALNYAINNHGTLTIKDSYATGEVNARGIYNGYVAEGDKITTAKLIIESGSFNAMGTNGGAAVYNYGIAEINGGKFQSKGGYGLNSQAGAVMTVTSADVRGGIYNCGKLTVAESKVYQHLSGKHCIYNWQGSVTIKSGEFDSESGNELILAEGQNASVVINGGEFHKTAKSWLYGAATDKDITFTITGGTHYGYVNKPEMTVDTFRPYSDPIVVTGGSYNFDVTNWCAKDYKAVKNAETAMWDVEDKVYVAKIGEDGYESLNEAVAAVQDGGTITLVADEVFTKDNYYNNGGWKDGLGYSGDKSFTIDLGGNTIKQDGSLNDYLIWIKNDGAKANTITFKNGTMDAGTTAYCALATASSNTQKMTINLENINLINNISNGAVVKARGGSELNVKEGTVITGKNSYTGIEAAGSTTVVNIYDGAKINQNGTSSSWGWLVGASGNSTVNVYGGEGTSVKGAFGAMTSGGTINISGGEWIANTDGTISNDNNGVLIAQSDKQYNAGAGNAVINVTGGTFKGGYNCYGNAVGDAQINISGGNFNADPRQYVVEGYKAVENNGTWNIAVDPVAKIETTDYATLQEAFNVGGNITLLRDVIISETATLKAGKTAVLDLNGYAITVPEAEKHIYALNNKGTLTIKDSEGTGRISARGIYNGYNGNSDETVAGAKLTVENGNFYALDSDGGACIFNCAEAIINGGTFDGQVAAVNGRKCGKTTINGGTFKSVSNYVIQQNGGGELTINKATVDRGFGAVGCYGGKVTIIDGTYMPTGMTAKTCHVVYVAAGADVTINGGTYKMNYAENAVPDSGSAVTSYYKGTLSITGGTFYAHFDHVSPVELSEGSSITGGTYYNHACAVSQHIFIKNFVAEGYELNANGEVVEK